MAKGIKTGGRKPGSLNKKTIDLLAICEEEGIEPFRAMVLEAKKMHQPKDKFDALEKICQYIYSKKRAVEVSSDPDSDGFIIKILDFSQEKK